MPTSHSGIESLMTCTTSRRQGCTHLPRNRIGVALIWTNVEIQLEQYFPKKNNGKHMDNLWHGKSSAYWVSKGWEIMEDLHERFDFDRSPGYMRVVVLFLITPVLDDPSIPIHFSKRGIMGHQTRMFSGRDCQMVVATWETVQRQL